MHVRFRPAYDAPRLPTVIGADTTGLTIPNKAPSPHTKRTKHRDPSLHLPASAVVLVHDEPVAPLPILVAYHKPFGVHSTIGDPMGRPNLEDALPPRLQKSFHPVGRLDADTTGLLLFSGDGQLTQRLLHPSGGVQRQYVATVEGKGRLFGVCGCEDEGGVE